MGQQEVYDLLKKHRNKWFSARELSKVHDKSFNTIVANLKRLRKASVVMYKTVIRVIKPAGKRPLYIYRYKNEKERKQ